MNEWMTLLLEDKSVYITKTQVFKWTVLAWSPLLYGAFPSGSGGKESACNTGDLGSVPQFSSVAQSCPTLRPHGLQHTRPLCSSPTPRVYPNSCPLSWWCHPTISSSVIPFSSNLQSFPASGSFPKSQLFAWGGQSIGVSASTSVLPMNIQTDFL